MAYALDPLLKIRVMREDRAGAALTAARRATRAAEDALAARQRDLDEYMLTKDERRDRIYDAIIGRAVTRDAIDLAAEGVSRIDQEGVLKADNVKRAESDLAARRNDESAARADFSLATRNRMKIDELKADWAASEAKESERRAETELEDFTVKKEAI